MNAVYHNWIDWMKNWGMYLVILGHFPNLDMEVQKLIYAFHMPLFFFLSGYVHKTKTLAESFRINIRRLLVPYLFFRILGYVWWLYFSFYKHPEIYSQDLTTLLKPIIGILIGVGYDTDISYTVYSPMWFLMALFWLKMFFHFTITNRIVTFFCICFSCLSIIFLNQESFHIYFSIDCVLMAYPFFLCGYCLKDKINIVKTGNLYLFILAFILFVSFSLLNDRVDMNRIIYGDSIALFYISAIAGIYLSLVICFKWFKSYNRYNHFFAVNTIIVLGIHKYLVDIFNLLLERYDMNLLPFKMLLSFVILLSCYPVILFCNKYIPSLVGYK